jgi:hypothetical protein
MIGSLTTWLANSRSAAMDGQPLHGVEFTGQKRVGCRARNAAHSGDSWIASTRMTLFSFESPVTLTRFPAYFFAFS